MHSRLIFPRGRFLFACSQLGQQIIRCLHTTQQPAHDGKPACPALTCVSVLEATELAREFMRSVLMSRLQFYHWTGQAGVMSKTYNQIRRARPCQVETIFPEVARSHKDDPARRAAPITASERTAPAGKHHPR